MNQKLKDSLLATLEPALILGLSVVGTYVVTALLNDPNWKPYYGVLAVVLTLLNEYRKA